MGTLESSEQLQGGAHVGLRLCIDPRPKRDELVRSDTGGASASQLLRWDNPCATLVATMEAAMIDWTRVILGVLVCLVVLSLGLWGYRDFAAQYSSPDPAVSERLEQIQQRLSDVETRLGKLEKYRQTAEAKESAKDPIDVSTQKTTVPLPRDTPHPPRTQYQVSPPTALQPVLPRAPSPDANP
jgi:hypothetical protein